MSLRWDVWLFLYPHDLLFLIYKISYLILSRIHFDSYEDRIEFSRVLFVGKIIIQIDLFYSFFVCRDFFKKFVCLLSIINLTTDMF